MAVVLSAAAQSPPASRIVVKLRAAPAEQTLREFQARHAVRRLEPLYPHAVEAAEVRQRFPKRARRFRGTFKPPALSRTYILVPSGSLEDALARLREDADVEYAEEDQTVSANYTPDDPYFLSRGTWGQNYDDLWGIKVIGAPTAWDTSTGEGVVVAVVDSGIDYTHPDIAANVWTNPGEIPDNAADDDANGFTDDVRGWNFVRSNNDPADDFGHGTHLAGTIAAVGDNGFGVIGVAWRAKVVAVKVLNSKGAGLDSACAAGIVYAADQGADVINLSWGREGLASVIRDAVEYAYGLGAVIVAGAGNGGQNVGGLFPAALPEVVAVAAADPQNRIASFSNWGSRIDLAAPGVDILSLAASGTAMATPVGTCCMRASGTSMAAPHVSGLAALILAQHPDYSNEDVRQVMRASAVDLGSPGRDPAFGYGGINAAAAMMIDDPLEVRILSPADGAVVQDAVTVTGFARGTGLASYTLELGLGETPSTWTLLGSGTAAVNGTLGAFDASEILNGTYVLRLTAVNATGGTFLDQVQIYVRSTVIALPAPPATPTAAATYKPGAVVSIEGMAQGAGFERFEVEWAAGINPASGWQSSGLTLTGGGLAPVSSGVLAAWDTSSIGQAGYYTIRVRVVKAALTVEARTLVYMEPDLYSPGWPMWLTRGPAAGAGAVLTHSGGEVELVAAGGTAPSMPGVFWRLPLEGPPRQMMYPGYGASYQPAGADLNGDGIDEVAIVDLGGSLWVFGAGNLAYELTAPAYDFQHTQVEIADLGGLQGRAILALGSDAASDAAYLVPFSLPGVTVPGNFPIQVADSNEMRNHFNQRRFLVGDVDGNGSKDIVVADGLTADTFQLRLFASDGSPRTWNAPVVNGWLAAMVAADLDHNGMLETILLSHAQGRDMLHVFQPDGSERPGWPLALPASGSTIPYLATADLGRDGREEIVLAHAAGLYVFQNDGTAFPGAWPIRTAPERFLTPVVADIDGDGLPEILATRHEYASTSDPFFATSRFVDQKLVAFQADGTVVKTWQVNGLRGYGLGSDAVPTAGDFDRDGMTEIAMVYGIVGEAKTSPGGASVLRTGGAYQEPAHDWPTIYHDAANTGVRTAGIAAPAPRVDSVENAASLAAGPVASGELVQVSGAALSLAEGMWEDAPPETLAGARVLFDGSPAQMVYARNDRIYAVVPASVEGKSRVQVWVERAGVASNSVEATVAQAAPGIFAGAILNQDGSLNGPLTRAPRNSVISVFATGTGRAPTVSVSIGGVAGQVISVTPLPSGIVQADVRVPAGAPAGEAVAVELRAGSASSQPGVTLAVRP